MFFPRVLQLFTLQFNGGQLDKPRLMADFGPSSQIVWVNNFRKCHGTSIHAVRGLSLSFTDGQVFGLLSVNGAGKTTTFKMLCGQFGPTAGEVSICGMNVATKVQKVRKLIGYCPQFDALLDNLAVEEHLYLYGRLKGLGRAPLRQFVL